MSKFRQLSPELWPLIDVKISTLYLDHFFAIFFKLCIRVDIKKEWFWIEDG